MLIVLYTVLWGSIGVLVALLDGSGRGFQWVARIWVSWCLRSCGVTVDSAGLENRGLDQPCVLMANHQSVFDIAALMHTCPPDWRLVAKRELLWIPFFGWALAASEQLFIDRQNRERPVQSLRRAAERVGNGVSVVIFPEGTRSPTAALPGPGERSRLELVTL